MSSILRLVSGLFRSSSYAKDAAARDIARLREERDEALAELSKLREERDLRREMCQDLAPLASRVVDLMAPNDAMHDLSWNHDGEIGVNCNDLFWWGCADYEAIPDEDAYLELETAVNDLIGVAPHWVHCAGALFCSRVRGMRPQGAFYSMLSRNADVAALFDACGPERSDDEPGNTPRPQPFFSPDVEAAMEEVKRLRR